MKNPESHHEASRSQVLLRYSSRKERKTNGEFDPRLDPGDHIQFSSLGRHTHHLGFGRQFLERKKMNWGVGELVMREGRKGGGEQRRVRALDSPTRSTHD